MSASPGAHPSSRTAAPFRLGKPSEIEPARLVSAGVEQKILLQRLLADTTDRIYFKDAQSRFIAVSAAKAERHGLKPEDLIGKTDADIAADKDHAAMTLRDEQTIIKTGVPVIDRLEKETLGDGRICWVVTTKLPLRDADGNVVGTYGVSRDVSGAIEAQKALEATNTQLIEATRQAGMAEVATGVLHNVGNVLTSINVTANLLSDRMRDSKVSSLNKVVSLLKENAADLPGFFAKDPRAAKLTHYLENLSLNLEKERQEGMVELTTLLKSVSHVKDIIWMQQSYASVSGIVEPLNAPDAIEDALKLSNNALQRHSVHVVREFADTPPARAERHKVLQILVNLISNAKKAMDCKEPSQRKLVISTERGPSDAIVIRVIDNGIGIPPENLPKIFSHGFTTRKDGHGFGLHSSAMAAKQMGATLAAFSDGPGKGATFTLALPCWVDALPSTNGQHSSGTRFPLPDPQGV